MYSACGDYINNALVLQGADGHAHKLAAVVTALEKWYNPPSIGSRHIVFCHTLTRMMHWSTLCYCLCVLTLVVPHASRADVDEMYDAAKAAYNARKYALAAPQFELLLSGRLDDESRQKVHLLLGRCYYELHQWSNSLAHFQELRAEGARPQLYCEGQFWSGRIYEYVGDTPKALLAYETGASSMPGSIYAGLASLSATRLYLQRGDVAHCRIAASNALECADGYVLRAQPLFLLGQCFLAEQQPREALCIFENALAAETNTSIRSFMECGCAMANMALCHTNTALMEFGRLSETNNPRTVQDVAHFYMAQRTISEGNTNEAAIILKDIVSRQTRVAEPATPFCFLGANGFPYADALYQLGQLRRCQGNFAEARLWYQRCAADHPRSTLARSAEFSDAVCAALCGEFSYATQQLCRFAASGNDDIAAASLMQLGDLERQCSNFAAAVAHYADAARAASNTPAAIEANMRLAVCYYEQEDYVTARRLFDELMPAAYDTPVAEDVQYWRAWCCLKQGKLENAREMFTAYRNSFPTGAYTYASQLQLGRIAYQLGDYADAVRNFTAVSTNSTDHASAERAAYELGWVFVRQAKPEEAIAHFSAFAATHTNSIYSDDVQYYIGETCYNMRDYARARSAFNRIVESYPDSEFAGPAAYWAAVTAFRMGEYEQCVTTLTSCWKLIEPTTFAAAAAMLKGDCQKAQGNYALAIDDYIAAATYGSNSYIAAEAQFRLGSCHVAASNWSDAIVTFASLTTDNLTVNRARAYLALGDARAASGDVQGALSDWLRVVYDYRKHPRLFAEAVKRAGYMYEALKEFDKAQRIYQLRSDSESSEQHVKRHD